MKNFILILAFTGTILNSCQKEDIIEDQSNELNQEKIKVNRPDEDLLNFLSLANNYDVSIDEAKEEAISIIKEIEGQLYGLKEKNIISFSSIETITNGKKESINASRNKDNNSVPDMYLFNLTGNSGYVLVSADMRAPGVLAYGKEKNIGEYTDNPGEFFLLQKASDFINNKRKLFEKSKLKRQKIVQKILNKTKDKDCILKFQNKKIAKKWATSYKNGPLVKTLWSQGGDYNNLVSKKCENDQAPVGCVATAIGQIMTYHKKPTNFKGRHMNWSKMTQKRNSSDLFSDIYTVTNNDAKGDIQHLLYKLGDKDLLDMDYNCDGSYSNTNKAYRSFKNSGYNSIKIIDHNANKIISEIKSGKPVYIEGCAFKKKYKTGFWPFRKTKTKYSSCHAWVIDGYVKRTRKTTRFIEDPCKCPENELCDPYKEVTYNESEEFLHNNFGWGGSTSGKYKAHTGWYRKGLYDANNQSDEASNSFRKGENNNYQFANKIIIDIK